MYRVAGPVNWSSGYGDGVRTDLLGQLRKTSRSDGIMYRVEGPDGL